MVNTSTPKQIVPAPRALPSIISSEPSAITLPRIVKKPRQPIAVACLQCQKRKCKCDGNRPVCLPCQDRGLVCQFDVAEGTSRTEDLKSKKRDLQNKVGDLEVLVNALQSGTDEEASTLLARLRIGEHVNDVVRSLKPTEVPSRDSDIPSGTKRVRREAPGESSRSSTVDQDFSSNLVRRGSASPAIETNFQQSERLTAVEHAGILPQRSDLQESTNVSQRPRPSKNPPSTFFLPSFDRREFLWVPPGKAQGDIDGTCKIDDGDVLLQPANSSSTNSSIVRRNPLLPRAQQEHQCIGYISTQQEPAASVNISPNIRNFFYNLPFSGSVRANNYPDNILSRQMGNLFVPTWAMMVANTDHDGTQHNVCSNFLLEAKAAIQGGMSVEELCGTHPSIGALFDEKEFVRAPMLSKWAARVIHSTIVRTFDMTVFGCMYILWYVMRWMIDSSPSTYKAMPEWIRPTPNQLFMPHPMMVDFIIWLALRELVARVPAMQIGMEWMLNFSLTLVCDWPGTPEEALCRNESTGNIDLTQSAKDSMHQLESWSLAPSFRTYVGNADAYVLIKYEHE